MENKAPIEIPLLIVLATIAILVFIFFTILFVLFYQKKVLENKTKEQEKEKYHKQQLLSTTIKIADDERKLIASNLHDDIGAVLQLVKLNLKQIEKNNKETELVKNLGNESAQHIETAMENIRSISRNLSPPVLAKLGFEEAISDLVHQINSTKALTATLNGSFKQPLLDKDTELQVYRIVQEVINNVVKHAYATTLLVDLNNSEGKLKIVIKHNGKGITNNMITNLANKANGIGLKNILSRAHAIHAKINYEVGNESQITIEL